MSDFYPGNQIVRYLLLFASNYVQIRLGSSRVCACACAPTLLLVTDFCDRNKQHNAKSINA